MKRYLDADTERDIREALRHQDFDIVAAKTPFDPEELRRLLNLPSKPAANVVADDPDYLWRADKLQEVL